MTASGGRLLVSAQPGECRAALLRGGRLEDLLIQRDDRPALVGNYYLGRVLKLDAGLDAAFVEIGLARPGLLPRAEAPRLKLAEGDAVIVKVRRAPGADKGARLSARLGDAPPGLEAAAAAARPPALLSAADDLLRHLTALAPEAVVVDEAERYAALKAGLAAAVPALAERIGLYADPLPLFEAEGVEAQIEALLMPRVALPSGGFLLIEPVETLTAVDVNSGAHAGRGDAEARALAVDLEAVPVLARQLRLRALSGLIVVDFLALRDGAARKRVTAALREALEADPESTRVFPMGRSGLLEMTRRRGRPPLHEMLTRPCGLGGSGREMDPDALAFAALRAARRAASTAKGRPLTVSAAPEVAAALQGPAAAARRALEARLGQPLHVEPDEMRDAYEIVLG